MARIPRERPTIDIPPLALSIRDRVLQAVESSRFDYEPEQRLSATGHCIRQQYYTVTGEPITNIKSGSTWEMRDGDIHEADVKRWLRDAGYIITGEHEQDGRNVGDEVIVELDDGTEIPGHIDGDIIGPDLAFPHLLEVKSMSSYRYLSAVKEGIQRSNKDYYLQVQGYMGARELPACLFAIKAKDSSTTKRSIPDGADPKFHIEIIPFDQEAFDEVYERHSNLRLHIKSGKLPPREYDRSDWHCDWCPFRDTCWS